MSIVRPLAGVRYNLEEVLLKNVIAPPYDVISPEMKDALKAKCPHNIVTVDLPDGEPEEKYANAAKIYKDLLDKGILARDKKSSFYVYEQIYEFAGKEYVRYRIRRPSQTGRTRQRYSFPSRENTLRS